MPCISPVLIRNDKFRGYVPCNVCGFCLEKKRADWSFRLVMEHKKAFTSDFLTFTYNDDNINTRFDLDKTLVQKFNKRLRKVNAAACDWPYRYYLVGEYGGITGRPHYHGIMFNIHPDVLKVMEELWPYGHVYYGDVELASIHYVTKYVINRMDAEPGRAPPFAFMSKRPGIGADYVETHGEWHKAASRNYTQVGGVKRGLPRYYKEKIFSKAVRDRLAMESIIESDKKFAEEIKRLSLLYDDPYIRYDQGIAWRNDRVREKTKYGKF